MILLKDVQPIPMLETTIDKHSDIWAGDCQFEKGKKYLVLAPSGKGKSTMLHLMYGLRNDYKGEIWMNDKKTSEFFIDDWTEYRRQHLSIVYQDLRLFQQLTALENILLKATLQNSKTIEEIQKMAKQLGISELLNKPCQSLSYGQQQRVAIIRSLCQSFDFLLLDEPFSHLDADNIEAASKLIEEECNAQEAGMILVSLGETYHFEYDHQYQL